METWKKNLLIICIAEFTVMMGFCFVTPFIPLYIEQLGHYTPEQASLWAGIASGGSGLAMFLSASVWGIVADRWGRKPMFLRAQFGAGAAIALLALSANVFQVIVLRTLQGILAGTVPAASALAAAQTPRPRLTFTMAMVLLSVQLGNMMGPVFGGLLADRVGFSATFFSGAALLVAGGFAVLFLVKEKFTRPTEGKAATLGDMLRLAFSPQMFPLLIVMCVISIGPQMIGPVISLLINSISNQWDAAGASGLTFSIMGGTTALAAFVTSRIARRVPLKKILIFCCIGTAVLYLPPWFAQTVPQMVILIGITGLMTGGLATASNTMIGYAVPVSQQGIAFGLGQSAVALGSGLGPFVGGGVGATLGLRWVFPVAAALFAAVGLVVARVLGKRQVGP